MSKNFYSSGLYRAKQSAATKLNWKLGYFDSVRKSQERECVRPECKNNFVVQPSDPKKYCSRRCAVIVNNRGRIHSLVSKEKISQALKGRKYPDRPKESPRFSLCLHCWKEFKWKYWRPAHSPFKYCSVSCMIKDIGSRPTSPKAARAKAGIRLDIDSTTYFFSRWEANYARILNMKKIKWIAQPKTFHLRTQKYTPDFYLPEKDLYIEIKNFLSEYSKNRDREFRELYPRIKLQLILKKDYLKMQDRFASKIETWEYS